MISVLSGNLFESKAQTWVNTVNCVGVMGKGVALGFKERFPEMFADYQRRCERGEVRLGRPYLFKPLVGPWIVNFPTKQHWRQVTNLQDIISGLEYLRAHYKDWGIKSLAVPPLGCGNGQLEWRVVGPTLYRHLAELEIPVLLYAPFGTSHDELQPEFLHRPEVDSAKTNHQVESIAPFRVEPGWIAIVAIIELVTRERYHWPIGRISFQKVAYFATEVGIPTGLAYRRGSYGPYSDEIKQVLTRLINNGLIVERKLGRMLATDVGPTYEDAKKAYERFLMQWQSQITAVADLVVRMNTYDAELAATVHFAAKNLRGQEGRQPSELEVLRYVQNWKQRRRRPPLKDADIALAIRRLNILGWLDVKPSPELPVPEEAMIA